MLTETLKVAVACLLLAGVLTYIISINYGPPKVGGNDMTCGSKKRKKKRKKKK